MELIIESEMAALQTGVVPNLNGSKGPKCPCGVCVDKEVGNSFHKCKICRRRVWAGICFAEESLEGVNGTCHACAKGGGAKSSSVPAPSLSSAPVLTSFSQNGSSSSDLKRWTGASGRVNGMKRKNMSEDFPSPPAQKKPRQSSSSKTKPLEKSSMIGGATKALSE